MTPKTDSVAVLRRLRDKARGYPAEVRALDAAIATLSAQGEATYVVCRQCDHCGHVGINDEVETDAACHNCEWRGPSPIEDHCPACKSSNCMGASCPKCGALYGWIADTTLYTSAPAAGDGEVEALTAMFDTLSQACAVVPKGSLSSEYVRSVLDTAVAAAGKAHTALAHPTAGEQQGEAE